MFEVRSGGQTRDVATAGSGCAGSAFVMMRKKKHSLEALTRDFTSVGVRCGMLIEFQVLDAKKHDA